MMSTSQNVPQKNMYEREQNRSTSFEIKVNYFFSFHVHEALELPLQ